MRNSLSKISYTRIVVFIILLLGLVMIRTFQNELFYDPFILFFRGDYHFSDVPVFSLGKLMRSVFFRYVMNAGVSLGIIYTIFLNAQYVRLSALLYGLALIVFMTIFLILVLNLKSSWYYLFFTGRRFLIQPVLLILFIAAFYSYQKR